MSEQTIRATPSTSPDGLRVRSFEASDRPHILRLHAATIPDSVDCECDSNINDIETTYFRQPQDHLWVADANGEIVGTVAICVHETEVAHIHCLRVRDDSEDHQIRRSLVQAAANHARHHGCLKLVIHAPQVETSRAARFLHRLGFEFSRRRELQEGPVLEFYLNLYETPEVESRTEESTRQ